MEEGLCHPCASKQSGTDICVLLATSYEEWKYYIIYSISGHSATCVSVPSTCPSLTLASSAVRMCL